MKRLYLIGLSLLALGLTACGQGGQLSLDGSINPFNKLVTGAEFTSSSAQYETSLINGYHVQQSVGDMVPDIESTSTSGYKLYSTVQGEMVSATQ